jgi:hypothetical protein
MIRKLHDDTCQNEHLVLGFRARKLFRAWATLACPHVEWEALLVLVTCSSDPLCGWTKTIPLQAWTGSLWYKKLRLSEFLDSRHNRVANLSRLTHRPTFTPSSGDTPGTHLCCRLSCPESHSAAGTIKTVKIPKEHVGNRTRDIPACSPVLNE